MSLILFYSLIKATGFPDVIEQLEFLIKRSKLYQYSYFALAKKACARRRVKSYTALTTIPAQY